MATVEASPAVIEVLGAAKLRDLMIQPVQVRRVALSTVVLAL